MTVAPAPPAPLAGAAPPSPAGPRPEGVAALPQPPQIPGPALLQTLRVGLRGAAFLSKARRELGEVFRLNTLIVDGGPVVTTHPDHVRSLFTAKPHEAPSLTGESPLRPIVGPNSVLTAVGPRHLRQRKLLLPPFHGDAIAAYERLIVDAAQREIATWQP